jgi:hypothetical protein
MLDEEPLARYDPASGRLSVRLPGGEVVEIAGLGPSLAVWCERPGEAASAALWLSAAQADVLGKMIAYVLREVKISPSSHEHLQALQPAVAGLLATLAGADGPIPTAAAPGVPSPPTDVPDDDER